MWLNALGISLWIAALLYFWVWWLRPEHVTTPLRYGVVTAVLAWVSLLPLWFIVVFGRAEVVAGDLPVPPDLRVAIVVTKAPSEPFDVVRRTLEGALAQEGVVHDTWLADEDPDPQTIDWCRTHGISVSTRKDRPDYHRTDWPRRTRCKEGNLAYFYDTYGYARYDVVSQFDADHVPRADYLRHVVGIFADPEVGYVSAPSICDSNRRESWAARGRLFVEASMHGALQCGYNAGLAPLCIGSHYTVRTRALQAIGGLGPELAEDHSTTLIFNSRGWKGVHAVDAIAHGEGPETFAALVVQEFQWSRSLVTILLRYSPIYVPSLSPAKKFQFLFSECWYPMFSGAMALMYLLPIVGLLSGERFVAVDYVDFFIRSLPFDLAMLVLAYWWRSTGLFRPADAPIVSWEGTAFLLLRWPWSLIGSLTAVVDHLTGRHVDFRVTPKGRAPTTALPIRIVAPYLVLAAGAATTALLVRDPGSAAGFYFFNLVDAVLYVGLTVFVVVRHILDNRIGFDRIGRETLIASTSVIAIVAIIVGAAFVNGAKGLQAMNVGIDAFTLTESVSPFAGAGQRGDTVIRVRPKWHGFLPGNARERETRGEEEQ